MGLEVILGGFGVDLGGQVGTKIDKKSCWNFIENLIGKKSENEARRTENSGSGAGAGGRGGGPKLIRSGKIWQMIQHARAPDGGPPDLKDSTNAADPEICSAFQSK